MKILKVIFALILTLAMLYVARNNSRGRPEYFSHQENGYTFEYSTVPKATEYTEADIPLTIRGDFGEGIQPVFRRSEVGGHTQALDTYDAIIMQPMDTVNDRYFTSVTAGKKNDRFYYYFEVVDSSGIALATFAQPDGSPFMFRFIGEVPAWITATHIFMIFATVFFIALGTLSAILLIGGKHADVRPLAKYSFLAALFAFLGGYPFGIPMNWFAFGGGWEGVPFGTDATDNKTQLLFIYLLLVTLATFGSLRGRPERDLFSPKALGWFGIGSFAVMLFIYLIPHSIQFSPGLTYTFCYSWIGIVALIYIYGRYRITKSTPVS